MKKTKMDLLKGTLELIVLRILQTGPANGWGVIQKIKEDSQDILSVSSGSVYPALYRLEAKGWIKAEWRASENNRSARFYRLTALGRKQLDNERQSWEEVSTAVNLILRKA